MTTDLLRLVAGHDLPSASANKRSILAAFRLAVDLAGPNQAVFFRAVLEGLLRVIETHTLADEELLHLSRYWDSHLGRERVLISERLQALFGVEPPPELVEHVRSCLEVQAWRKPPRARVSQDLLTRLFERAAGHNGRSELRCELCGFHFRPEDLGQPRRDVAEDLEIKLSTYLDPRRKEDPLKPLSTSGDRSLSLTQLTVDHLVPVAGFGWTELSNLRVLCQFCNGGKLSYRRGLEAVAPVVAASLQAVPEDRPHSILRQVAVVAAIASGGQRCGACGRSVADVELTVRLGRQGGSHRCWLVPWNVDAVCYDCAA